MKLKIGILLIALVTVVSIFFWRHSASSTNTATNNKNSSAKTSSTTASTAPVPKPGACDSNSLSQNVIVSISKQHMWACSGTMVAYENPVITGMQMYPSELTPVGSYHIYSKLTDQTLAGSDFTGHWSDYVYYWMPFLDNQYGTYGFHDLTQQANGANGRADSDFGNVDVNAPYTAAKHGSHGCVEMPLAAAKWLYNWASVGTTVTVQA